MLCLHITDLIHAYMYLPSPGSEEEEINQKGKKENRE
jgi:hypothetical protein